MSFELQVIQRQRGWRVDTARLREIAWHLCVEVLGFTEGALGVHLIGARRMASMNWQWLKHEGSTDILTFDHRDGAVGPMNGELFISVDDAVRQAAEFGVGPGQELVRYVVHGVLHLTGYDDLEPGLRRVMKREETRLVRVLEAKFRVGRLVMRCGARAGERSRGTP
jgi:probable rRNA maturation factor